MAIEFYDCSQQANGAFGNDVAYLLFVAPENKAAVRATLEPVTSSSGGPPDPDLRLLELLKQHLPSYFEIQEWLQANSIPFEKKFDDWA